jgi:hypothetical protein
MTSITFDRSKITGLYGNPNNENSLEIFKSYLNGHQKMMQDFERAFEAGMAPLCKCVHFYAAVFTYVGFPQLTSDCHDFCKLCAVTNKKETINSIYKKLFTKINDSAGLLQQEIESFNKAGAAER